MKKFGLEVEVGVGILRNQEAVAVIGDDCTVFYPPIGGADRRPVVEILAVEQHGPAAVRLGHRVVRRTADHGQCNGNEECHADFARVSHVRPPVAAISSDQDQ